MNSKIKTGSILLLTTVLITGTVSMTIPSSFAQPYAPDTYAVPSSDQIQVGEIEMHKHENIFLYKIWIKD